MKFFRTMICITAAAALVLCAAGCTKKTSAQFSGSFTDLELGETIEDIEEKLGTDYELTGTTPAHAVYTGIRLLDFLGKDENTKLSVFLNTENKTYAYAYYMYDAIDSNYDKLKAYLTERYGEPVEGENASEQWKDGDVIYSVNKQPDYLAIGKF